MSADRRALRRLLSALAAGAWFAAGAAGTNEWSLSGAVSAEFESAYLSSSGTLCDTRPVASQNLDWNLSYADWGCLWGYGTFLSALHDYQHELHRAAFNEFEGGVFYGYDWKINDTFTLWNSAGGIWNPLFGYRGEEKIQLWEWRYYQTLKNPYLTPFWDALGKISPTPSWVRVRLGVLREFRLTDTLVLTPVFETVWADRDRFEARYGELPDNRFLGGAFATITVTLKLEWFFAESWSCWFKFRQFDTVDPQARRLEEAKLAYWAVPDCSIFTLGLAYRF